MSYIVSPDRPKNQKDSQNTKPIRVKTKVTHANPRLSTEMGRAILQGVPKMDRLSGPFAATTRKEECGKRYYKKFWGESDARNKSKCNVQETQNGGRV
ncbi:unnamed protein product [Pieris macdunnoughi]|uniref:Uncharacterized protein n=1 Tax=Pieris macdunnoughi TaxID=345717 RepID=A0A821VDV8_9NEOP|nr:unnamed protein product [Pieris macdunnoughi]